MECDIENNPFPESWMVYLTFGQSNDFYITFVIPVVLSLISGRSLSGIVTIILDNNELGVSTYLSWLFVLLVLVVLLFLAVYRIARRTYSSGYHNLKHMIRATIAYLLVSSLLVLFGTLLTTIVTPTPLSQPTHSEIGIGSFLTIFVALTHISIQYSTAIYGTYSDRSDVNEAIPTLLRTIRQIEQSPNNIKDEANVQNIIDNSKIIIEALESAPLSDERQLYTCLCEWLTEGELAFEDAIPAVQEKIITGSERTGEQVAEPIQDSHDRLCWIRKQLRTISNKEIDP